MQTNNRYKPRKCTKTKFASPAAVQTHIQRILIRYEPGTEPSFTSYKCDICGSYHLTSMFAKTDAGLAEKLKSLEFENSKLRSELKQINSELSQIRNQLIQKVYSKALITEAQKQIYKDLLYRNQRKDVEIRVLKQKLDHLIFKYYGKNL